MKVAFFCMLLAGCAQISGLDNLGLRDASQDVADGDVDGPSAIDASLVDAPKDAANETSSDGACSSPADCPGNVVCCETVKSTGSSSSCTLDADTVACVSTSTCPTTVVPTCGTDILRRCTANADCTEPSYPRCCTIPAGDASSREICLTQQLASLVGGTCL
jgi:hypothetical protein